MGMALHGSLLYPAAVIILHMPAALSALTCTRLRASHVRAHMNNHSTFSSFTFSWSFACCWLLAFFCKLLFFSTPP